MDDWDFGANETIIIDCDRCEVRGDACSGCVVSELFGPPQDIAHDVLADAGSFSLLRSAQGAIPIGIRSARGGRRAG